MFKINGPAWENDRVENALRDINPALEEVSFDPASTDIKSRDLPFYPKHMAVEISDGDTTRHAIYNERHGEVFPITWRNDVIYHLNDIVPVEIDRDTVVPYVNFFFHFVKGRHGRFMLIDNASEINWKDAPDKKGVQALDRMIQPLHVEEISSDGTYTLPSYMIFKDSLFKADAKVEENGLVNLVDEELLVEDLPVYEDPNEPPY
jgi:hypothetical protein